jgi:dinuclear metal center YbgI/SA1388 family protein
MQRNELLTHLNELLQPQLFQDYGPNGLQVEGRNEVKKIITGVTACQALLDKAVEEQADCVLVHHGYFWQNEDPRVIGMKQRRLKTLLTNNINLIGYHLPLDAHAELGNNVQLAKQLDIKITNKLRCPAGEGVLLQGEFEQAISLTDFEQRVVEKLQRQPLVIAGGEHEIKTIAWCTGGAPDFINEVVAANVDAYLTGEVAERTTHTAREEKVHFISAGHHATERYGVKALGEYLAEKFALEVSFIDVANPV